MASPRCGRTILGGLDHRRRGRPPARRRRRPAMRPDPRRVHPPHRRSQTADRTRCRRQRAIRCQARSEAWIGRVASDVTPATRPADQHRCRSAGPDRDRRWQLAAQFGQPVDDLVRAHAAAEAERDDVAAEALRPPARCPTTGVCAPSEMQRAPSIASRASAISRPSPCGSPGKVASSTRGRAMPGIGQRRPAPAQHDLLRSRVKACSSIDLQLRRASRRRRPAYSAGPGVDDEAGRVPCATAPATVGARNRVDIMAAQQIETGLRARPRRGRRPRRRRGAARISACSCSRRRAPAHDSPGPVAGIEQPLEHAQLLDLLERVGALAEGVALRRRKAVAALPDAQRVLAEPGIALDRGDREPARLRDRTSARRTHRDRCSGAAANHADAKASVAVLDRRRMPNGQLPSPVDR